jgi:hypothetical protein
MPHRGTAPVAPRLLLGRAGEESPWEEARHEASGSSLALFTRVRGRWALVAFALVTHNLVPSPVQQYWLDTAYGCVLISLSCSLIMTFVAGARMFDVIYPDISSDEGRASPFIRTLIASVAVGAFFVGLALFLTVLNVNL